MLCLDGYLVTMPPLSFPGFSPPFGTLEKVENCHVSAQSWCYT